MAGVGALAAALMGGPAWADHCGIVGRPACSTGCEAGHGLYPSPAASPEPVPSPTAIRCAVLLAPGPVDAEVRSTRGVLTVAGGLVVMLVAAGLWTTLPGR